MTTFAQTRNGRVLAHFTADLTIEQARERFADIAHELYAAPDDVQDGWAFDGQTFAPYVEPVKVPDAVTMRQARLALLGAGILSSIDAAIDTMPSPQKEAARIEWEYSQEVHRDQPLVLALAPALGLTDAQIDALFIAASAL